MKLKQVKKGLAFLLSSVMVISMMMGCGNKSNGEDAAGKANQPDTEDVAEGEIPSDKMELEYVKLKVISVGDPDKASDVFLEKVNELLMRDLNCELEIQYLSWTDYKQQYPLCFASGEDFDFIYAANWCDYSAQALKGGFYELAEEDIGKYMPMTNAAVGDKWEQVKIDGKIFMVPYTDMEGNSFDCFAVRGDLMKEVGLDDIGTAADMEKYLDNVVENHPEMDVINVTNSRSEYGVDFARAMLLAEGELDFDYVSNDYNVAMNSIFSDANGPIIIDTSDTADLKLVDEEISDAYYLKLFNKVKEYQQKGYWKKDCLSKVGNIEELYLAGNGAIAMRQIEAVATYAEQLLSERPETEATYVRINDCPVLLTPATNNGVGISANSKNPERTMMVIEKLGYEQEYVDLLRYGIEGVHYNVTENGDVELIKNPEYVWSEPTSMGFNNISKRNDASRTEKRNAMVKECVDNAIIPLWKLMAFDKTAIETEAAACSAVNAKYQPLLYTGLAEDVEATYEEYKNALEQAGYDKVVEEYLRQAQVFYNSRS